MLTLLNGSRRRIQLAKDRHARLGERADENGIIVRPQGLSYRHSIVAAAAIPALVAFEALRQRWAPHVDAATLAAGVPLLLGPKQNFARTYETLGQMLQADANQPESQPWVLFDTQTYLQAGPSDGFVNYFNNNAAASNTDPTLSNFPTGKLDADYYFEIHRVHTFIHAMPNTNATTAVTGAANDVEIMHKTARGIVNGSFRGKNYLGYNLSYFGRPGGPVPTYAGYGSGTAANNTISAGETAANGGFPVLGNVVLSPANQWKGNLQFVPATAISTDTKIMYGMMGVLHRPVA